MDLTSTVTIAGNLTRDPELRQLPDGKSVVGFTVASTPRKFNRETKEWEDGEATFMDCSAFDILADNIAASLTVGQRVIVSGRLKQDNWTDKDSGTKRSKIKLEVDEVGPSLKFGTTTYTKGGGRAPAQPRDNGGWATPAGQQDPWANASANGFEDSPF